MLKKVHCNTLHRPSSNTYLSQCPTWSFVFFMFYGLVCRNVNVWDSLPASVPTIFVFFSLGALISAVSQPLFPVVLFLFLFRQIND